MRGKGFCGIKTHRHTGITPAYAGKSSAFLGNCCAFGDHPRVCGEKASVELKLIATLGSPPRMRGKGFASGLRAAACGITPAYAGKRKMIDEIWQCKRDHPRVCGEKIYVDEVLPADTWITPAYAGKRHSGKRTHHKRRDHPRVCGEKSDKSFSVWSLTGSPPRMRGKVNILLSFAPLIRITPAYAGKREAGRKVRLTFRDHPRVCGEKV